MFRGFKTTCFGLGMRTDCKIHCLLREWHCIFLKRKVQWTPLETAKGIQRKDRKRCAISCRRRLICGNPRKSEGALVSRKGAKAQRESPAGFEGGRMKI